MAFDRKAYMREYNKNYRAAHKTEHNESNKRYREKHANTIKRYKASWKQANPDYFKTYGLKQYGLTLERFNSLIREQNDCCAICTEGFGSGAMCPVVDHNHETGVIRGILHRKCNSALGLLGDSVEGLERALAYLKRS